MLQRADKAFRALEQSRTVGTARTLVLRSVGAYAHGHLPRMTCSVPTPSHPPHCGRIESGLGFHKLCITQYLIGHAPPSLLSPS